MKRAIFCLIFGCALLFAPQTSTRADRLNSLHLIPVTIEGPRGKPIDVVVAMPRSLVEQGSALPFVELPTLIALHGQAAVIDSGARTVFDRYQMQAAFNALKKNQVGDAQYLGWSSAAHNAYLRAELSARLFPDLIIIAPPVPNFFVERPEISVEQYAQWLAGPMLQQLRKRFASIARERTLTGIAGVSMGATLAMRAGFLYPEVFGSVTAIEPALRGEALQIADDAKQTSRSQYIQIVMPAHDEYLLEAQRFSLGLRQARVPHAFVTLPGEHGERFAAGAGSIEILRLAGTFLHSKRTRLTLH